MLVIELPERVPDTALGELRRLLSDLSPRFEERRPGEYDINVSARRVGAGEDDTPAGDRPFLVSVMGPGIGDVEIFEAEHADEPQLEPFIGFHPTHAVDVIAMCNSQVDHIATALLTAAIMDVVGGVANVELREDQVSIVAGLPGLLRLVPDWEVAFGTPDFLRAWAARPGFRLVK
ncbi:hypothetical protein Pth03_12630 [Planotetraspora thailandica]|uniref:Uncharacterized protein n=1 Tax=Planotetraspora thailandica TaxID=487172 RepID=A0A8J3V2J6_9ACTN|nr:hypothetical protein Pth03_12630 [Planotetraspora thailandica]